MANNFTTYKDIYSQKATKQKSIEEIRNEAKSEYLNSIKPNQDKINIDNEQETQEFLPQTIGDIALKLVDTTDYLVNNTADNFVKGAEGMVDTVLSLGTGIFNLFGADTTGMENFIAKDWSSYLKEWMNDFVGNIYGIDDFNFEIGSGHYSNYIRTAINLYKGQDFKTALSNGFNSLEEQRDESFIPEMGFGGEILEGASGSIGQMLPSILIGNAAGGLGASAKATEAIGLTAFGFGAGGQKIEESLQNGDDLGKSIGKGTISGGIEVLTEIIGGKVLGASGDTILGSIANKTGLSKAIGKVIGNNRTLQFAVRALGDMTEEGLEEIIGNYLEPLSDMIFEGADYEAPTFKENLTAFLTAALVSGAFGSAQVLENGVNGTKANYVLEDLNTLNETRNKSIQNSIYDDVQMSEYGERKATLEKEMTAYLGKMSDSQRQSYIRNQIKQGSETFENYDFSTNSFKDTVDNGKIESKHFKNNTITNLDKEQTESVESIRKITERLVSKNLFNGKVIIEENITSPNGSIVDGYVDTNGDIYINISSAKAPSKTFIHELVHLLEGTNGYNAFKGLMTKAQLEAKIKELTPLYEGVKNVDIESEAVAEYMGDLLHSKENIKKLFEDKPSIFKKIYNFIKEKISSVGKSNFEKSQLKILNKSIEFFEDAIVEKRISEFAKEYEEIQAKRNEDEKKYSLSKPKTVEDVLLTDDVKIKRFSKDILKSLDKNGLFKINNDSKITETMAYILSESIESVDGGALKKVFDKELLKSDIVTYFKNRDVTLNPSEIRTLKEFDKLKADLDAKKIKIDEYRKKIKELKIKDLTIIKDLKAFHKSQIDALKTLLVLTKKTFTLSKKINEMSKKAYLTDKGEMLTDGLKSFVAPFSKIATSSGRISPSVRGMVENYSRIYTRENCERVGIEFNEDVKSAIDFIMRTPSMVPYKGKRLDSDGKRIEMVKNTEPLSLIENSCLNTILGDLKNQVEFFQVEFTEKGKESIIENATESIDNANKTKKVSHSLPARFLRYATNKRNYIRRICGYADNTALQRHFDAIKNGETIKMQKTIEYITPFETFKKQNKKYFKTLNTKVSYKGVEMTRGQLLSLYELSKRKDCHNHLLYGGVSFINEKGDKIIIDNFVEDDFLQIGEMLTAKDTEYLAIVDNFFKNTAKDILNFDEKYQGWSYIVEDDFYFPMKSDRDSLYTSFGSANKDILALPSHASWNNSLVNGANNALTLGNIDSVVGTYAMQVANYIGLQSPIVNLNRLLNRKIDIEGKRTSLKQELAKIDPNFYNNIYQYLSDICAVNYNDTTDKIIRLIRKHYTRFTLAFNVKVGFTQMASLPNAAGFVGWGNLAKAFKYSKSIIASKALTEEMYKYCPYVQYRNNFGGAFMAETGFYNIDDKIDVALSAMTNFFDSRTIKAIWCACKENIATKYKTSIDKLTDAQLLEAGDLLETTVRNTQPNFNPSEKSDFSRSKGVLQLFTVFKTQPIQNLSQLTDAISEYAYKVKNGFSKAEIKKAGTNLISQSASVITGLITYSIIAELFKAFLETDDDKDSLTLDGFITQFKDSIIGMFPIVGDIIKTLTNDYNSNGNFIQSSVDSIKDVYSYIQDCINGTQTNTGLRKAIYGVGMATGIPVKNAYNYATAFIDKIDPSTAITMRSWFYDIDTASYVKQITAATNKNQATKAGGMAKDLLKEKGLSSTNEFVNIKLAKYIGKGYTNIIPKQLSDTITYENTTYKLTKQQMNIFKSEYNKVFDKLQKIFMSSNFTKLSEEEQANVIKYLFDTYYEIGVSKTLSVRARNKFCKIIDLSNANNIFIATAYINNLHTDSESTKKEKADKYLNTLPISKLDKYIILALNNYKSKEGYDFVKISLKGKTTNENYKSILDMVDPSSNN